MALTTSALKNRIVTQLDAARTAISTPDPLNSGQNIDSFTLSHDDAIEAIAQAVVDTLKTDAVVTGVCPQVRLEGRLLWEGSLEDDRCLPVR